MWFVALYTKFCNVVVRKLLAAKFRSNELFDNSVVVKMDVSAVVVLTMGDLVTLSVVHIVEIAVVKADNVLLLVDTDIALRSF